MFIVWFLLIGLAAGWLAGQLTSGRDRGLKWNLVIGVIGSVVGGLLFGILGLQSVSPFGSLVTSTVGAIVLIVALRYVK